MPEYIEAADLGIPQFRGLAITTDAEVVVNGSSVKLSVVSAPSVVGAWLVASFVVCGSVVEASVVDSAVVVFSVVFAVVLSVVFPVVVAVVVAVVLATVGFCVLVRMSSMSIPGFSSAGPSRGSQVVEEV